MKPKTLLTSILCLLGLPLAATAQVPIYSYDFNAGSGTTVIPDVGAPGTGTLTTVNNGGGATNFYSADAAGVSGLSGDYAFNNSATVYGNGFYSGGFARSNDATSANTLNLGTLSAFTLSMWINPTTDLSTVSATFSVFPRLAMIGTSGLDGPNATSLYLALNTNNTNGQVGYNFGAGGTGGATARTTAATTAALSGTGWKFLAVTFDVAADTFQLYVGDTTNTLTTPTDTGTYNATNADIAFGTTASAYLLNRNSGGRAFDGLTDEFALHSGVLTPAELDSVRLAALVPEPTSSGLVAIGALGTCLLFRRRSA